MPSGDVDFGDNFFSFQHAPENPPNGNMLLYDNGNRRDHMDQTGVTKVVEIAFTGNPPTDASIVWEHTVPVYTSTIGDADRQPGGNTLITAGRAVLLIEVDPSGTEVWRLELPLRHPNYLIYRSERIASLLVDAPSDTDGDGLTDYVDNCADHTNLDQTDTDGDTLGDDCDHDDDTLLDVYEAGTGVFVSETDTGTDPLLADTDGDGAEVLAGTNPNDPPPPVLSAPAAVLLAALLALSARRSVRHRRSAAGASSRQIPVSE
jgi:hypothetical protein